MSKKIPLLKQIMGDDFYNYFATPDEVEAFKKEREEEARLRNLAIDGLYQGYADNAEEIRNNVAIDHANAERI